MCADNTLLLSSHACQLEPVAMATADTHLGLMRLQVVWSDFREKMPCCPSIIPEGCAHWDPLRVQADS